MYPVKCYFLAMIIGLHPFSETKTLLWECCIEMLFTDNSICFSAYSLFNSVSSLILLKLKWNEMKWWDADRHSSVSSHSWRDTALQCPSLFVLSLSCSLFYICSLGLDLETETVLVLSVRVPGCQKLQMTAHPGLAQDALYSCTHMATVGVKG